MINWPCLSCLTWLGLFFPASQETILNLFAAAAVVSLHHCKALLNIFLLLLLSFALWFANSKHTRAPFAFCLPLRLLEKGCWFVCQSQCDYTFNYLLLFFWAIISSATAQLNLPTFPLLSSTLKIEDLFCLNIIFCLEERASPALHH